MAIPTRHSQTCREGQTCDILPCHRCTAIRAPTPSPTVPPSRASRNHVSRLCSARRPQQQSLSPHSPPSCTWQPEQGGEHGKDRRNLDLIGIRGVRGIATRAAPLRKQARTMLAASTAGLSTAARPICSGFYPVDSLALRGNRTQRQSAASGLTVTSCSNFNETYRHLLPLRP